MTWLARRVTLPLSACTELFTSCLLTNVSGRNVSSRRNAHGRTRNKELHRSYHSPVTLSGGSTLESKELRRGQTYPCDSFIPPVTPPTCCTHADPRYVITSCLHFPATARYRFFSPDNYTGTRTDSTVERSRTHHGIQKGHSKSRTPVTSALPLYPLGPSTTDQYSVSPQQSSPKGATNVPRVSPENGTAASLQNVFPRDAAESTLCLRSV